MARRKKKSFSENRRQGWGMGLFRNRADGWIGGVCAGLGDHWDVPYWMVRLGLVAVVLTTGAFWVYFVGWVLMAGKPSRWDENQDATQHIEMEYDEEIHTYRPKRVFRYSGEPGDRLRKARERLDDALSRVESMERYVTSRQYHLNREFSKL